MCDYITERRRAADPILLAGLFHRQCVIIHPFMDGNGRTARLLTTGILGQGGLDIFRIFAFENYYNRNISRYFQAVGLRGDYYETEKSPILPPGWNISATAFWTSCAACAGRSQQTRRPVSKNTTSGFSPISANTAASVNGNTARYPTGRWLCASWISGSFPRWG